MNIQIQTKTLEKNYVFTSEIDNLCIWLYKYILFWNTKLVTVTGEGGRMKQWLAAMETSVLVMGALRLFSGSAEIFAALLMLYVNDAKKALFINGMLAFVGPTVLILTMTVGIASVASEISFLKLFFLGLGIFCIFIALLK
jgi:hypothetical protein